ncbi:MAG: fibrobacter succinogenes major paralogous domain-containing protein, partial [Bacteroidales bacterium]|nr:fibrobacter succinogenes major paralogous domain-containing protein [Bacteroidales bacterium]
MKRKMQITKRTIPNFCFNLIILILLSVVTHAQSDSIADIQGNKYKIIKIGDQWWMAENLRVNQYANGEAIPHLKDNTDWTNTSGGAFCYYNDNQENLKKYGNLYNWHAVNDEKGICPEGWHVATDREWIT